MIKLVRVKAGDFGIDNAVKLEELETKEQVEKNIIYPLEYLDYPKYELTDENLEKVSHGNSVNCDNLLPNGVVILVRNNKLIAVAKNNNGTIKCEKVFI